MSYYEMINHEHVSYYPSLDHDFLISSGHWVLQQVVSQQTSRKPLTAELEKVQLSLMKDREKGVCMPGDDIEDEALG